MKQKSISSYNEIIEFTDKTQKHKVSRKLVNGSLTLELHFSQQNKRSQK
jgi:hypothetical protein